MSNIEEAKEQGGKLRLQCCQQIRRILTNQRCVNDTLVTHKKTIIDFLEKSIRKGSTEDRVICCSITSLICVHLGRKESIEVFTLLKPILRSILHDSTSASALRASSASTLGLVCFIGADKTEEIVDCLDALKKVFSQKVLADSKSHALFSSALTAWSLLLNLATEFDLPSQIDGVVDILCEIIERGDLNLRIAAGETAALVFEVSGEMGISLNESHVNELLEILRNLSNESGHQRGKREKKTQKSTFREILKSVENGYFLDKTIRFGVESMELISWSSLCKYNVLKEAIGSGINSHLQSNALLREIFCLGEKISKDHCEEVTNKCEKEWLNSVNVKARKKSRNRQRDDKHAVFYEEL